MIGLLPAWTPMPYIPVPGRVAFLRSQGRAAVSIGDEGCLWGAKRRARVSLISGQLELELGLQAFGTLSTLI